MTFPPCFSPGPARIFFHTLSLAVLTVCLLAAVPAGQAQTPAPRAVVSAFTPAPVNTAPAPAAPAPAPAALAAGASASSILSPNDAVDVSVYQEDDLHTTTLISQEGTISLPLVGIVKVGGLTQVQARDRVADLLRARFLVNPQVSFTVIRSASKRFTILGQINRPGPYEIPPQESIDLLEAIAMAGGYTRSGKASNVTIRRQVGGSTKIFTEDAGKMAKDSKVARFMISPGDNITVAETIF